VERETKRDNNVLQDKFSDIHWVISSELAFAILVTSTILIAQHRCPCDCVSILFDLPSYR
jgi:hypothetical protein